MKPIVQFFNPELITNLRREVSDFITFFDYYLGIPYSNDMGPGEEGSKSDLGVPLPKTVPTASATALKAAQGEDETGLKGASQPPLPLVENTKVIARVKQDEQQAAHQRMIGIFYSSRTLNVSTNFRC